MRYQIERGCSNSTDDYISIHTDVRFMKEGTITQATSVIVARLKDVPGVDNVVSFNYGFKIWKGHVFSWDEILPHVLALVSEHVGSELVEVQPQQPNYFGNQAKREEESLPLPAALRNDELSEQEIEALYRNVADPNSTKGRLKRIPDAKTMDT